ncbi:hypothetical protein [Pyxidicoccus xibeiensis]|uniref:hypothetical protein n=1 Tax=Pyxidicoccus xibeiensis TaxID=2906759 RepID=UPI0020A83764|nr:hypothetical protein [Pyxidicoccus xibeiensis]MCP3143097.1 hypothetical protein [Pyxidicoccus xibeiensis]
MRAMSLPSPRPLSADEAAALNARIPAEFEDYLGPRSAGDSVVPGPLHLPAFEQDDSCIILGDLHVDGLLVNPEHTSLVVTGSLRAGTLLTLGKVLVLGDAVVAGDVYGNSFNNQVCGVRGSLTARCVLEKGHSFQVLGGLTAEAAVSLSNVISAQGPLTARLAALGGMNDEERRRVFDASLFDDAGSLSEPRIVARLRAGLPLLRAA